MKVIKSRTYLPLPLDTGSLYLIENDLTSQKEELERLLESTNNMNNGFNPAKNDSEAPYADNISEGKANRENYINNGFEKIWLEHGKCYTCRYFKIRNTTFDACNMSKLTLSDTPLRGIDLSTCDISGMIFKPSDVVGCQVSANQAVEMIKNFGVIVKF